MKTELTDDQITSLLGHKMISSDEDFTRFARLIIAADRAQRQAVHSGQPTTALIEECKSALAEELAGFDIDPPLHHVKQAHDKCVAWLLTASGMVYCTACEQNVSGPCNSLECSTPEAIAQPAYVPETDCGNIAQPEQQTSPAAQAFAEAVNLLLNNIEEMPEDLWSKIDTRLWNAVLKYLAQHNRSAAQPEQTAPVATTKPVCSDHPDAPHGFNRNASHSAHRYVCDCEGWEPDDESIDPMQTLIDTSQKLGLYDDAPPVFHLRQYGDVTAAQLGEAIAQPEQTTVPTTAAQYSRCSDTLRNLGKPYARTCAECGRGPCKTKPAQPEQPFKWDDVGKLIEVTDQARAAGLMAGTSNWGAFVCRAMVAQPEQPDLKALVQKVHKAKGRHHSQIAMCDLYDACGLTNVRPGDEPKEAK